MTQFQTSKETEKQLAALNRTELQGIATAAKLKGTNRMRRGELQRLLLNVPGIDGLVERLRDGKRSQSVSRAEARHQKRAPVRAAAGGDVGTTAVATVRGSPSGRSGRESVSSPRGARGAPRSAPAPGVPVAESQVLLMTIGPCAAHTYWQVDRRVFELARRWLGDLEARQVLRFHDLDLRGSGEPGETFDIEIEGETGSYYLDTWSPGRTLRVEIGMRSRAGEFAAVGSSNEAELPRDSESDTYDARTCRLHRPVSGLWKARRSSRPRPLDEGVGPDAADAAGPLSGGADSTGRDVPAGDTVAAGTVAAGTVAAGTVAAGTVAAGAAGGVPDSRGETLDVPAGAPLKVPAAWESSIGTSSGELVGSSFSSDALLDRDGRLRVRIEAQLLVRGRTQPGTELSIEGVAVPVNADGTFQLSFSVPSSTGETVVSHPGARAEGDKD